MTKKNTKKVNKPVVEPVVEAVEAIEPAKPATEPRSFVNGDIIKNIHTGKVLTYHHQSSVDANIEQYLLTGIRI